MTQLAAFDPARRLAADNLAAAAFAAPRLPFEQRPAIRLFTRELPRPVQYEAWAEQLSPVFRAAAGPSRPGFVAELEAWDLGALVLVRTRAPRLAYGRDLRQCRSDGLDHWLVSAVRSPSNGMRRRDIELRVRCLDWPVAARLPAGEAVHLVIARDFLRDAAFHPLALGDAPAGSPLGRRLAGFLFDLAGHMREFSAADLPGLAASLRAMLLACLAPAASALPPPLDRALLERARRLVQRNLYSPSLGVDQLCRELGVSRSRLYRLFGPLGGVVHYIRARRLLDAHRALADLADTRAIIDIAAERGFGDPAEFSRAFKRAFGYRPSDARRIGVPRPAGLPPSARGRPARTLAELLGRLA